MDVIVLDSGREIRPTADGRWEVQPAGDNYWLTVDTVEEARRVAAGGRPGTGDPETDHCLRELGYFD